MDIASIAAAVGSFSAAALSTWNRRKIAEIHVLVNSNLEAVVAKLSRVKDERDQLLNEREKLHEALNSATEGPTP